MGCCVSKGTQELFIVSAGGLVHTVEDSKTAAAGSRSTTTNCHACRTFRALSAPQMSGCYARRAS
jgi:hypothetical protein